MIRVIVDNLRRGEVSSVIPHANGKYPVWFKAKTPEFIQSGRVHFIDESKPNVWCHVCNSAYPINECWCYWI